MSTKCLVLPLLAAAASCAAIAAAGPATPNPGLHYYYEVRKANPPQSVKVDVCVYGGTPGGVKVMAEGNLEHLRGKFRPYPISYRAIVPRQRECENLFVPVCLSSTHAAFGSLRTEPVFMILGQSAGTAAVLAIDAGVPVQQLDYARLCERLLADGQLLTWSEPRSKPACVSERK
jgi:hypothetical protein